MNILFIEDETELSLTGVAQLEARGYKVYPVFDLAGARAVFSDPKKQIHLVIADHRLPDGLGIQFVIEMRAQRPECEYAIVSGCLSSRDVEQLEALDIPYYHKPLLYGKVVEELRRMRTMRAPLKTKAENSEVDGTTESARGADEEVSESAEADELAPRKKLFGLF